MVSVLDSAGVPSVLEASQRQTGRRAATRSSIGDSLGDEESRVGGRQFAVPDPPRLPQVLTGMRVLVVDDDEDTRQLFATALGVGGADVFTASSATGALRALADRAFDVIVSDIAMPGADGYWLVREIQQLGDARARTPVLAVTAFGGEHFRARVLAAGFIDRLEKPVDPAALCRAVAQAGGR